MPAFGQAVLNGGLSVDPALSSITISGDLYDPDSGASYPFEEQSPGSLTDVISGSLLDVIHGNFYASNSNVNFAPSGILIGATGIPGDDLNFANQPGPFDPGNAPANYAASIDLTDLLGEVAQGAFRGTTAYLSFAGAQSTVSQPGDFSVSGAVFQLNTTFGYDIPTVASGSSSASASGLLTNTTPGNLQIAGNNVHVAIPLSASTTLTNSLGLTLNFNVTGTIVANGTLLPSGVYNNLSANGLVVNGGFETGDLTGWTVGGFGETGALTFNPQSGQYAAYLEEAGLSQMLNTTPGQEYKIDFWLSDAGGTPNELRAMFGGQVLLDQSNVSAQGYTEYTFYAYASSYSTLLDFESNNNAGTFWLDNVSVTAVPEPASLCLAALGGFVLLGFRRRG